MATSPDSVRAGLILVTAAAKADIQSVASAAASASDLRASLFAAAPLIVSEYSDGAAALALDWYEEIRDAASPRSRFTPTPLTLVTDDDVKAMVAAVTVDLASFERQIEIDAQQIINDVAEQVQKEVASGFRDTITGNSKADPDAAGWKRFAQLGACKFCVMLAAKGGVYTQETARFAAHENCDCIAGPEFGGKEVWAEATPQQYLASKKHRSTKEHAELRAYLNRHFPDSPG